MKYNIDNSVLMAVDTVNITNDSKIIIEEYEKRNENRFYDVKLEMSNKAVFIGRFDKEFDCILVKYKDGKILVYIENFISEIKQLKVTQVLTLYNVLDDIYYSASEEDLLNMFDENIDTRYLKNSNNKIYRTDLEKKKRLKINNY